MVYLAYEVSDSGTNLELTEYPLVLVRNPSKGNTMNLVDNLNKTANEESESETLQNATQLSEPASTPLGGQMQGDGTDAAKMQGTPLAKKGETNERLNAAAEQEQQRVDPQAETVDDYKRTQNIQDQTLGKAEEEAKAWSDKMASSGSNANNVSKLIIEQTQNEMRKAQSKTYAEEILSDANTLDNLSNDLGVSSDLLEDVKAEIGDVFILFKDGKTPTNEQLESLKSKLPEGVEFSKIVGALEKAFTSVNVGENLADNSINAEDVTLSSLMDEGLVDEEMIRLFLGIDESTPLPEDWENKTMAELNREGSEEAARQAEDLRIQQQKAGLKYDAGGALENITDMQEAEAEQADSVQFGDKRMSVDDFLDNDRIKGEMNDIVLDEELMKAEGEELDAILKEKFGEQFESNPEYYYDMVDVGKANKDLIKSSLDSAKVTQEGIEKTQSVLKTLMTDTGLTADMFSDMTGLDFSTWDMSASDLAQATEILGKYSTDLVAAFNEDPDFFATLKKEEGQSWAEFAEEINKKLGAIGIKGGEENNNFELAQEINKNFDENGKFIGNVDKFTKDLFGFDKAKLKSFLSTARVDPRAANLLSQLPDWMTDSDGITANDLANNFSKSGGLDLDALQGMDLIKEFADSKIAMKEGRTMEEILQGLGTNPAKQKDYFKKNFSKMTNAQKEAAYKHPYFEDNGMGYDLYGQLPKHLQKDLKNKARAFTASEINKPRDFKATNDLLKDLANPNSIKFKQMKLAGNAGLTRLFYNIGGLDDKIGKGEVNALKNYEKAMLNLNGGNKNSKEVRAAKLALSIVEKGFPVKYMGHHIMDQVDRFAPSYESLENGSAMHNYYNKQIKRKKKDWKGKTYTVTHKDFE